MLLKEVMEVLNYSEVFIHVGNNENYEIDYDIVDTKIRDILKQITVNEILSEEDGVFHIYGCFKGTKEKQKYEYHYLVEAHSQEEANFLMLEKMGVLKDYEK